MIHFEVEFLCKFSNFIPLVARLDSASCVYKIGFIVRGESWRPQVSQWIVIIPGWGFLFSSGLVDFFFWSFFLCSNIMERLEFSSWTWWCNSGGIIPWEIFQRVFLTGWGFRGAKGHFLSYFAPFRHLLVSFFNKVFPLLQPSLFSMLCVEWVYALVPIPGVYILPCLVQYAWFIPTNCVAKLGNHQVKGE